MQWNSTQQQKRKNYLYMQQHDEYKIIMLRERRVTQESAYCVIPFILILQQATLIYVEKKKWWLPLRRQKWRMTD